MKQFTEEDKSIITGLLGVGLIVAVIAALGYLNYLINFFVFCFLYLLLWALVVKFADLIRDLVILAGAVLTLYAINYFEQTIPAWLLFLAGSAGTLVLLLPLLPYTRNFEKSKTNNIIDICVGRFNRWREQQLIDDPVAKKLKESD